MVEGEELDAGVERLGCELGFSEASYIMSVDASQIDG